MCWTSDDPQTVAAGDEIMLILQAQRRARLWEAGMLISFAASDVHELDEGPDQEQCLALLGETLNLFSKMSRMP